MPLISAGLWDLAHSYKHFPWSPIQQSPFKLSLLVPYITMVQQQSHQDIFLCGGSCWFKPFPSFMQLSCFTSSWGDTLEPGENWMQQMWTWESSFSPAPFSPAPTQLCFTHSLHPWGRWMSCQCFLICFQLQKVAFKCSFIPSQINNG